MPIGINTSELYSGKLVRSKLSPELLPFTQNGAQVLFTFCSELYERVAMIVTTNLNFADWTQLFGDERLAAALLDRLTHHAHILELLGESYRFRPRIEREVG